MPAPLAAWGGRLGTAVGDAGKVAVGGAIPNRAPCMRLKAELMRRPAIFCAFLLLSQVPVQGNDSELRLYDDGRAGQDADSSTVAAAPSPDREAPELTPDNATRLEARPAVNDSLDCGDLQQQVELSLQTGHACHGCLKRLMACTRDAMFSRHLASEPEPVSSNCTGGSDHADEGHGWEAFLFFLVAVTIGAGVLHLTMSPLFHVLQFTVVLFVLGLGAGILAENSAFDKAPMLKRSFEGWMSLDPHLLLFAFLPPLLAGDAMTIDTHLAKRCAAQCLLLAGPGVIMGSFATAYVVYSLPYNWDFPTCLAVGSILAATDPVAVVGLLKDLGASPVLTILIQGESLLNDGTAIVLFTIAYEMVAGKSRTAGEVVAIAFSSTLGAVAVGFTVGVFFYWWIKNASDRLSHHSSMIQISLTICAAYWSFILAEGGFHWSGVLSTVTSALVLAHKMWPLIVEREAMLGIWHMIETIGNAIVFFLSGAMTGKAMLAIEMIDFVWAFVVYLAITVIRLVMFLMFLPLLRKLGQNVSGKDVLMMSWGGLRGMVGLALAILVQKDLADGNISPHDGDRILFLVGCIASFTLIINATTSPAIATSLGILAAPQGRTILLRNVAKRVRGHMEELVDKSIKENTAGTTCVPAIVKEMITNLLEEVDDHLPEVPEEKSALARQVTTGARQLTHALDFARQTSPQSMSAAGKKARQEAKDDPWGRQTSAESATSHTSTSSVQARLRTLFGGQQGNVDVFALFKRFDRLKLDLLRSGVAVTPFKFGKELDDIKNILYTEPMNMTQLRTVRDVFLEVVRANYWEQMQSGRFVAGSPVPQILLNSINLAKEQVGDKVNDWQHVYSCIRFSTKESKDCADGLAKHYSLEGPGEVKRTSIRAATASGSMLDRASMENVGNMPWFIMKIWHWYNRRRVRENYRKQSQAIQVINSFIEAHQAAQEKIASYFGDDADVDSPEEAHVIIESQIEVYEATIMRGLIHDQVLKRVNTLWKLHQLAEQYSDYIHRVHETGVMNAKEAEALLHPVQTMQRTMRSERRMKIEAEKMSSAVAAFQAAVVIQRWKRRSGRRSGSTEQGSFLERVAESRAVEESGAGDRTPEKKLDDYVPEEKPLVAQNSDEGFLNGRANEEEKTPQPDVQCDEGDENDTVPTTADDDEVGSIDELHMPGELPGAIYS